MPCSVSHPNSTFAVLVVNSLVNSGASTLHPAQERVRNEPGYRQQPFCAGQVGPQALAVQLGAACLEYTNPTIPKAAQAGSLVSARVLGGALFL